MNCAFRWRVLVFAVALGIVCGSGNRALAQTEPAADLSGRIDSLEKQLADLRSQMDAQKAAAAAAAAPTPAPAAAVLPAAAPAAAPAPTGLAALLGPTTLSGFVDVYYGYNSNQPADRTTAFRNFDINSCQFALNMLELVADKAPDATASRLGYHIASGLWTGDEHRQCNRAHLRTPAGPRTNFDQYLKEGYLEYLAPVGKGLQINVGKFVTPAGAEVIETKDNWNYSRGSAFRLGHSLLPFRSEREVCVQSEVCRHWIPGERLEQQRRQQQRQDHRFHCRLDAKRQVQPGPKLSGGTGTDQRQREISDICLTRW